MEEKKHRQSVHTQKSAVGASIRVCLIPHSLKETKSGTGAFEEVWECEAGNWNERSLFLPE